MAKKKAKKSSVKKKSAMKVIKGKGKVCEYC